MKVSALIPAKGFAHAKQRLASLLSPVERALLAESMLRDVLGEVTLAGGLEGTFVVTGDPKVSGIASSLGVQVIREKEERGETEAVVFALAEMKRQGISTVLVLPADIPLVRSSDIDGLLEYAAGHAPASPFALLVPAHDRMGTNALLLSPPDVIRLRFGYDSFSYHLRETANQGLPLWAWENDPISLDIDGPNDLERFMQVVAPVRGSTALSGSPPKGGSCSPDEHDNRARVDAGETYLRLLEIGVAGGPGPAHRTER